MVKVPTRTRTKGLFVVECSDQAWLGQIQKVGPYILVYTGLTGRPPAIPVEDVDEIVPALEHPDVVDELIEEELTQMERAIDYIERQQEALSKTLLQQSEYFKIG